MRRKTFNKNERVDSDSVDIDSDYGQLSQETWTFMHDIYDGGPVLFYEGEKDNEEEKQDLQDEEEDIQQEWKSW